MVLSSPAGSYLVDLLKLRASGQELAQLFEDIKITKVGIDIEQQLLWLQRDFSVFSANVFDFREILRCENLSADPLTLSIELFEETIRSYRNLLFKRPLAPIDYQYLSSVGRLPYRILTGCHRLCLEYPIESLRKTYYLSNVLCERDWVHRPMTLNEMEMEIFSGKENVPWEGSDIKLKRLHRWREHAGRMYD